MIGDADCTAQGEALCHKFEIRGYPTIKYFKDGDVSEGQDYQGGRDFESLQEFVVSHLEVKCNVQDPVDCSDKELTYMEKMKSKSKDERMKELDRLTSLLQGSSMKRELRHWISQRLNILKGLEQVVVDEL